MSFGIGKEKNQERMNEWNGIGVVVVVLVFFLGHFNIIYCSQPNKKTTSSIQNLCYEPRAWNGSSKLYITTKTLFIGLNRKELPPGIKKVRHQITNLTFTNTTQREIRKVNGFHPLLLDHYSRIRSRMSCTLKSNWQNVGV